MKEPTDDLDALIGELNATTSTDDPPLEGVEQHR